MKFYSLSFISEEKLGEGRGVINFLPLKMEGLLEGGGLFERGGLIEDLRYSIKVVC